MYSLLQYSEVVWKSDSGQSIQYSRTGLPWCAFYTDIIYSVKVVEGGMRMVLQFDVFCDSGLPIPVIGPEEEDEVADVPAFVGFNFAQQPT